MYYTYIKWRFFLSLLVVFVMYKVIWKIVNKINLLVCISGSLFNCSTLSTQLVTEI